jgi:hypothetical protein
MVGLLVAFLVTTGCAKVENQTFADTSVVDAVDTIPDTTGDTVVDMPVDTHVDTASDTLVDTMADTTTDTGVDTVLDTTADTDVDTMLDTTTDTGSDPGTDPGGCAAAVAAFDFDFDTPTSCSAWTHSVWSGSGCGSSDSWECGSVPGWPSNPPGSTGSLGTDLDGWPLNDECSWIASPTADLSACAGMTIYLEFQVAYSLEVVGSSCHDGGFVAVNDGSGWSLVDGDYDHPCSGCHHLSGENAWCQLNRDWFDVSIDVSSYMTSSFQVRFAVEYDDGYPWSGLFVDDVRLRIGP